MLLIFSFCLPKIKCFIDVLWRYCYGNSNSVLLVESSCITKDIFNTQVVSLRILQQFQHEWLFLPIEGNILCFFLSWMSVCIPKNPITNHLIQLHLRIVLSDWLRAFPDITVKQEFYQDGFVMENSILLDLKFGSFQALYSYSVHLVQDEIFKEL